MFKPANKGCAKKKPEKHKMSIQDYELHRVIGEGSFGKVFIAIDVKTRHPYAIKILDKYHIMKVALPIIYLDLKNKKVESAFRERDLLRELSHPNIIKQYYTF
jgi:protein-serine/threonine kinase